MSRATSGFIWILLIVSLQQWESALGSDVGKSGPLGSVEQAVEGERQPAGSTARSSRWRRRALSVNQDLTALAGLVHDAAYRRRYNHAMSTLDQLGKRAPVDDLDDLWMLQLRRR